jgi:hypothetical protein
VLQKPDFTAADGVSVTGVGGFPSPFFGTSAAAPHAAAIAALVKSRNLNQTAAQVRAALFASVIDIEAPGVDRNSGFGILMADAAVAAANVSPSPLVHLSGDFDGDGKADIAVFRPSTGAWYILNSRTATPSTYSWGAAGDIPVPGDYDGDGKTDGRDLPSLRRRMVNHELGARIGQLGHLGRALAIPYLRVIRRRRDGKADIAVFRALNGRLVSSIRAPRPEAQLLLNAPGTRRAGRLRWRWQDGRRSSVLRRAFGHHQLTRSHRRTAAWARPAISRCPPTLTAMARRRRRQSFDPHRHVVRHQLRTVTGSSVLVGCGRRHPGIG